MVRPPPPPPPLGRKEPIGRNASFIFRLFAHSGAQQLPARNAMTRNDDKRYRLFLPWRSGRPRWSRTLSPRTRCSSTSTAWLISSNAGKTCTLGGQHATHTRESKLRHRQMYPTPMPPPQHHRVALRGTRNSRSRNGLKRERRPRTSTTRLAPRHANTTTDDPEAYPTQPPCPVADIQSIVARTVDERAYVSGLESRGPSFDANGSCSARPPS